MIDKRIKNGKGYRNKLIKELKICLNLFLLQFRPKKKILDFIEFLSNFFIRLEAMTLSLKTAKFTKIIEETLNK